VAGPGKRIAKRADTMAGYFGARPRLAMRALWGRQEISHSPGKTSMANWPCRFWDGLASRENFPGMRTRWGNKKNPLKRVWGFGEKKNKKSYSFFSLSS